MPISIRPPAPSSSCTDHLGTPQVATTSQGAVAWQGAYTPFGSATAPKGLLTQNLRFPGQYADVTTGWSQNGFRDYDPALGRYLESDPIGLLGGINRYAYDGNNPTNSTDPLGLAANISLLDQYNSQALQDWANSYQPDGYNSVVVHGTTNGNFAPDAGLGAKITPQQLADKLMHSPGYDPSLPTRIVACQAGNGSGGAQSVANALGENSQVQASPSNLTYPASAATGSPILGGEPIGTAGQSPGWLTFTGH